MARSASAPEPTNASATRDAAGVDTRAFKDAMGRFATGVTVIAADDGDAAHAMTASSLTSVSLSPPLILFCVGLEARLTPIIRRAGRFAIHILSEDQRALAELCAVGAVEERLAHLTREEGRPPRLERCLARLDCDLYAEHPGGDHAIFVGAVKSLEDATAPPTSQIDQQASSYPLLWWRSAPRGLRELD